MLEKINKKEIQFCDKGLWQIASTVIANMWLCNWFEYMESVKYSEIIITLILEPCVGCVLNKKILQVWCLNKISKCLSRALLISGHPSLKLRKILHHQLAYYAFMTAEFPFPQFISNQCVYLNDKDLAEVIIDGRWYIYLAHDQLHAQWMCDSFSHWLKTNNKTHFNQSQSDTFWHCYLPKQLLSAIRTRRFRLLLIIRLHGLNKSFRPYGYN